MRKSPDQPRDESGKWTAGGGWSKVGGQKGSNPGGVYENTKGDKFYVKFYKNVKQGEAENAANNVYRAAGVGVPDSRMVQVNGQTAYASAIMPIKQLDQGSLRAAVHANPEQAAAIHVASSITQNWDVVGLEYDNLVKNMDTGKLTVVDSGGSFTFRAQGAKKPYTPDAKEFHSLQDETFQSGKVFKGIYHNERAVEHGLKVARHLRDNAETLGRAPYITPSEFRAKADAVVTELEKLRKAKSMDIERIAYEINERNSLVTRARITSAGDLLINKQTAIIVPKAITVAEIKAMAKQRDIPWDDAYADRVVRYWASDDRLDRQKDIVEQDWNFKEYEQNPVMLYSHKWDMPPVGNVLDWQVQERDDGSYTGKGLQLTALFATKEQWEWADTVFRLVKANFLRTGSVGFGPGGAEKINKNDPRVKEQDGPYGYRFTKNKLMEWSPTSIPANAGAWSTLRQAKNHDLLEPRDIQVIRELTRMSMLDEGSGTPAWKSADSSLIITWKTLFPSVSLPSAKSIDEPVMLEEIEKPQETSFFPDVLRTLQDQQEEMLDMIKDLRGTIEDMKDRKPMHDDGEEEQDEEEEVEEEKSFELCLANSLGLKYSDDQPRDDHGRFGGGGGGSNGDGGGSDLAKDGSTEVSDITYGGFLDSSTSNSHQQTIQILAAAGIKASRGEGGKTTAIARVKGMNPFNVRDKMRDAGWKQEHHETTSYSTSFAMSHPTHGGAAIIGDGNESSVITAKKYTRM
jgi:hypothetical protein